MLVTKAQKEHLNDFILRLVDKRKVAVANDLEHKCAMELVAKGAAVVTKKKNYGRIAEIRITENL